LGDLALIEVSSAAVVMEAGRSCDLTAAAFDADGASNTTCTITWTTDGGGTVNGSGTFHATNVGTFHVSASNGWVRGVSTITITPGPPAYVNLTRNELHLSVNGSVDVDAWVSDAYWNLNDTAPVVWELNGGGVVDANGTVTALVPGSWTLYANSSSASRSIPVSIDNASLTAPHDDGDHMGTAGEDGRGLPGFAFGTFVLTILTLLLAVRRRW
jgi:hypothetical protein